MVYQCHIFRFFNRPDEARVIDVPESHMEAVEAYLKGLWNAAQIDEFYFTCDDVEI